MVSQRPLCFTLSLGVASVIPERESFPKTLIVAAARALYEARIIFDNIPTSVIIVIPNIESASSFSER